MPTIISSNLKRFQRQKELSIPKLAEQSGVSARTIERIRSGKHVPDTQTILKLEKALGQDEGALVRGAVKKSDKHLEEFSKRETKEILKRGKDPKGKYITLEEAMKRATQEWHRKIQECKDFAKFKRNFQWAYYKGKTREECTEEEIKQADELMRRRAEDPYEYIEDEDLRMQLRVRQEFKETMARLERKEKAKRQIIRAIYLTVAFLFGLYVFL